MEVALYEPDIALNTGAVLRTAACLRAPLHIIEPCGFPFSEKAMRRSAMDYFDLAKVTRHASWKDFEAWRKGEQKRLVLLTTKAAEVYSEFHFGRDDVLLAGRESAGVPDAVHAAADARVKIPMAPGARSLNVGVALAIVLGESLRQTGGFAQ